MTKRVYIYFFMLLSVWETTCNGTGLLFASVSGYNANMAILLAAFCIASLRYENVRQMGFIPPTHLLAQLHARTEAKLKGKVTCKTEEVGHDHVHSFFC